MFCTECGQESTQGQFCTSCGSRLNEVPEASAPIGQPGVVPQTPYQPNFSGKPSTGLPTGAKVAIILGGLAVVIFGVVIINGGQSPYPAAVSACGLDAEPYVELADGNKTLLIDTEGEDDFGGASYEDADCVLAELSLPERINNRIGKTRALDGQLTDNWDGNTITWSYHPNSGAEYTISRD